ncbi:mechanosensitive ion channel [Deinococcus malanensis]|uniref:mechanosensitive ion channel n=1 Tax=Deinococcus malanensis TaxID=1706855 RepID=UPI0036368D18
MDILERYWMQFLNYAPSLISALVLIIVAFVVAAVVRGLVVRGLQAARVDERLSSHRADSTNVTRSIGQIIYYIVLLLFLPGILGALGLRSLLEPATTFFNTFLGYLPNILGAILILVIGFFVAKILRELVTTLTSTAGLDRMSSRLGLPPSANLSNLLGLVVYALVIIPVITAALDALNAEAITAPITAMLNEILAALPNLFAAILVLGIAFFVGRIIAGIVSGVLASLGFDRIVGSLGMKAQSAGAPTTPPAGGTTTPPRARTHWRKPTPRLQGSRAILFRR